MNQTWKPCKYLHTVDNYEHAHLQQFLYIRKIKTKNGIHANYYFFIIYYSFIIINGKELLYIVNSEQTLNTELSFKL